MMQYAHEVFAAKGWHQRQADGFAFAFQTGQITRSDYMEISGVSAATASRDLGALAEAGVLIAEGLTRSRVYRPGPLTAEPSEQPAPEQLPLLEDM